jgi:hypothetical protein
MPDVIDAVGCPARAIKPPSSAVMRYACGWFMGEVATVTHVPMQQPEGVSNCRLLSDN